MKENKIIDITAQVNLISKPTEEDLKLIDDLNSKTTDNSGNWLYVENVGVVWKPRLSAMPSAPLPVPPAEPPPPLLERLVQWGNIIDFDNISYNSVVMIKLNVDDPMRVNMLQRAIAKQVLEPRINKLKEKRVCVLFVQSGDDISVMTEEEMNKAGWEKKEKSRIITL